MRKPYRECPYCGAHLDADEKCDCQEEQHRAAAGRQFGGKLIAICREIDRNSGSVAVYPLDMEVTENSLKYLQMRAQFSPETRYFITTTANFRGCGEAITGALKRRTITKDAAARVGGLVEL